MIHAFCGMYGSEPTNCIRGNGKTLSMTGYLWLKHLSGYDVYTNYFTDFSKTIDSAQNIIVYLQDNRPKNVIVGFTEFHNVINSLGSSAKQIKFIDLFASQIRKLDCDALYDTQRFMSMNNRLRYHTDYIWLPEKRHPEDLSLCNNDRCKKEHDIYLYRYKPYYPKWIRKFKASVIGKHYDTKQIVFDTLVIEGDKK
jgi:hypothetical protein